MTKVITYGTYDLLHYGHIRLLERAKALGDWLIVGVTSDDFDKSRGKINVQQPLMERIEALRQTGIADEIIVEEYEGQKIDDIKRFGVDIFTVGSDWAGKFDYLSDYCKVVYLPRTEGVSSSEVRAEQRKIRIGFIGDYETRILTKYYHECSYVNGIDIAGVCARSDRIRKLLGAPDLYVTKDYSDLLTRCDAVYILSNPLEHYRHAREALEAGVHVLCEAPITLDEAEYRELKEHRPDGFDQDRLLHRLLPPAPADQERPDRQYRFGRRDLHQHPGDRRPRPCVEQYLQLGADRPPADLPDPGNGIRRYPDRQPDGGKEL